MKAKILKPARLLVVVFILSVLLGIVIGALYVNRDAIGAVFLKFAKSQFLSDVKLNPRDVPEIVKILDPVTGEDEQLRATRALAERVGPKEALALLKDSGLPYTGEGHFAVHQVGYVAWERFGEKALLHCEDYFLYACYHGAVIEAANSKDGFPTIKKMTNECREYQSRYVQCVHAAGHAILAIWNYQVDRALPTCDELFGDESPLTYCHSGVFMENIFGVHDWDKNQRGPERKWLSDSDEYFPCNAFEEKYQIGCWQNQATRIYEMKNGDIGETAKSCEGSPEKWRDWCFDSLARQIHPMTENDANKVYSLCVLVGEYRSDSCIVVNAGAYFSVGDGPMGIRVCNAAPESAKSSCFDTVISYVLGANSRRDQKRDLCMLMDQNYAEKCQKSLESS